MSEKYITPLDADQFQQALFEDRFPVTYHDCEQVAKITEYAIEEKGHYTIEGMRNDMGYVISAYDAAGLIIANFVINRPVEAENRRIPTRSWLRMKFKSIGRDFKDRDIKNTHKEIELHVRDGGTWELLEAPSTLSFELSIRGKIKSKLMFFEEGVLL